MRSLTAILAEVALVGGAGLLVALAANAATDGIELGRDYFPVVAVPVSTTGVAAPAVTTGSAAVEAASTGVTTGGVTTGGVTTGGVTTGGVTTGGVTTGEVTATGSSAGEASATDGDAAQQAVADRLAAKGLRPIFFDEVAETFNDPMRGYGLHVFIDARDDSHYAEGHIPGALAFDYYHPDASIAEVTAALASAMKVVIYCNGGDCEDSEFAALFLQGHVGDPSSLYVYPGGITEWKAKGMDVERGARDSGDIVSGQVVSGDESR